MPPRRPAPRHAPTLDTEVARTLLTGRARRAPLPLRSQPDNSDAFVSAEAEKAWMPVDLYVGGAEHAVLHLLYARFWHKVLYDLDLVSTKEPFAKLVHQGMILGEDGEKMSKSRGNVVNPDDIVDKYGGDAMRLYEMFMGPLEAVKPWQTEQVSERGFPLDGNCWPLLTLRPSMALAGDQSCHGL